MRTLTIVIAAIIIAALATTVFAEDGLSTCLERCNIAEDAISAAQCENYCRKKTGKAVTASTSAATAPAPQGTDNNDNNIMLSIRDKLDKFIKVNQEELKDMKDRIRDTEAVVTSHGEELKLLAPAEVKKATDEAKAATKAAEDAAEKAKGYSTDIERMKGDLYGKGKGKDHDIGVVARSKLNRTKIFGNPDEEPDGLPAAHKKIVEQEAKILSLEAHITAINTTVYNKETGLKALNDRLNNEETGLQAAHDKIFWNRMGAGAFFLIVCCVIWYSRRLFLNHEHETEKSTPEAESAKEEERQHRQKAS